MSYAAENLHRFLQLKANRDLIDAVTAQVELAHPDLAQLTFAPDLKGTDHTQPVLDLLRKENISPLKAAVVQVVMDMSVYAGAKNAGGVQFIEIHSPKMDNISSALYVATLVQKGVGFSAARNLYEAISQTLIMQEFLGNMRGGRDSN